MQTQLRQRPYEDDEISFVDLFLILRRQWAVVVVTTVLITAVAIIISLMMTPVFRAETVIREVQSDGQAGAGAQALLGQFSGLAGLAGLNLEGFGSERGGARALIESRSFIEEFIARNDLLAQIFDEDWDAAEGTWKPGSRSWTIWQGAEEFRRQAFDLQETQENGLLVLSVEWTDPDSAAKWANQLVALANEISRQKDIASARRSVEYLNEQINQTKVVELQRVLYNLLEAELRTLILANARDEYAFQVIDPAVAPIYRASPRRKLIAVGGVFVGACLGLVLALVRGLWVRFFDHRAAGSS